MLKKLRVKFICINMIIVAVMLGIILSLVLQFTENNLEQESIRTMESVLEHPMPFGRLGFSSASLSCFTVEISPWGTAEVRGDSHFDLSDKELLELVGTALKGDTVGFIENYALRYYRAEQMGRQYIVFADISGELHTMQTLRRSCLFIGLGSFGVFLLISILLARWAVKPVEKAWTQQKQFVSDASHELKTPLTVILTNAELLRDAPADEEQRSRFTDSILTMARQMRGLVESLLELARADNGAVKKAFTHLDLSALTANALLPFDALFFERELTLEDDIDPGIRVRGSESHLRQVTEILLDNARKYSAPGTVRVALKKQHGHALLSVVTPGEPLSPAECRDIFKRFYRADKARAMDHSYGLGLAIADTIVQEHGGKIWCEGKDNTNTFYVQLPTI